MRAWQPNMHWDDAGLSRKPEDQQRERPRSRAGSDVHRSHGGEGSAVAAGREQRKAKQDEQETQMCHDCVPHRRGSNFGARPMLG